MNILGYNVSFKQKGGIIVPAIMVAFVAMYVKETTRLFSTDTMLLVRLVLGFMAISFILTMKEELKIKKITAENTKKKEKVRMSKENKKSIIFCLLMFTNLYLLNILGFIITAFLFIAITMSFLGIRDYKVLIFVPGGLILFVYLLFQKWLLVPLPSGIFGF